MRTKTAGSRSSGGGIGRSHAPSMSTVKPLGWAGFMGTVSRQLINIATRAVATINAGSPYSGCEMRILEDLTPAAEYLCQDRGECNSDSRSRRCRAVGLLPLQSRWRSRNQNRFRPSPAVTGDLPRNGREDSRRYRRVSFPTGRLEPINEK